MSSLPGKRWIIGFSLTINILIRPNACEVTWISNHLFSLIPSFYSGQTTSRYFVEHMSYECHWEIRANSRICVRDRTFKQKRNRQCIINMADVYLFLVMLLSLACLQTWIKTAVTLIQYHGFCDGREPHYKTDFRPRRFRRILRQLQWSSFLGIALYKTRILLLNNFWP